MIRLRTVYIIVLLITGCASYFLQVTLSGMFVIPLEMDPNFCLLNHAESTGSLICDMDKGDCWYQDVQDCLVFKNSFEEAKYYNNKKMEIRNKYGLIFVMVFSFLFSMVLFYIITKIKYSQIYDQYENYEYFQGVKLVSSYLAIGMLGVFSYMIIGVILSNVLPAPATYFPEFIADIRDAQVNELIRKFKQLN